MDAPQSEPIDLIDLQSQESAAKLSESRANGGRNRVGKKGPSRQKKGSLELPNGGSWLRVRADFESGAFTIADLAHMYGIPKSTIRARSLRDNWVKSLAPEVSRALPGLAQIANGGIRDEDTIEAVIAQAEGRPVDSDAIVKEQASTVARRKAGVLRDHRDLLQRYRLLFVRGAEVLEEYSQGRMKVSFVRGTNVKGEEMVLSFSMFSRQSGFIDAVDKLGGVLERVVKMERQSYGLEEVDGDGNPLKMKGPASSDPLGGMRLKSTEELESDLLALVSDLRQHDRVTPVPAGVVIDA